MINKKSTVDSLSAAINKAVDKTASIQDTKENDSPQFYTDQTPVGISDGEKWFQAYPVYDRKTDSKNGMHDIIALCADHFLANTICNLLNLHNG